MLWIKVPGFYSLKTLKPSCQLLKNRNLFSNSFIPLACTSPIKHQVWLPENVWELSHFCSELAEKFFNSTIYCVQYLYSAFLWIWTHLQKMRTQLFEVSRKLFNIFNQVEFCGQCLVLCCFILGGNIPANDWSRFFIYFLILKVVLYLVWLPVYLTRFSRRVLTAL